MQKNRLKEKITQGKLAIGAFVTLADPAVVEMIGLAGYDVAYIDMEHTAFDMRLVQDMVRACDVVGICSLVRVPENNPKTILRVLEMGAQAVQVPHIAGREDALAAVNAVHYGPVGERGVGGPTRAARYGTVPVAEHMRSSNAEIVLSVMVEDLAALRQIEDIAAVDGVDMIAIGPNDLTQALGASGPADPKMKQTVEGIAASLKKVGKARLAFPMNATAFPLDVAGLRRLGVAYATCNPTDIDRLMMSFRDQVKEVRAQM